MRGLVVLVVALGACDGEVAFPADPIRDGGPSSDALAPDGGATDVAGCTTSCPFASQRCDALTGACVECVVDAHCLGEHRRRCDVTSHRCVECALSTDCEDDNLCETTGHVCMPRCGGDAEACESEAPRCDETRSVCICDALSCSPERPRCDARGRCVQCATDGDCAAPAPRCREGTCVGCVGDGDCGALRCDPVRSVCSE